MQGVDVTFEMRLTGPGGGVWTVHIHDGRCDVASGFRRARRRPLHGRGARLVRRGARNRRRARPLQARPDDEGRRPRSDGPLLHADLAARGGRERGRNGRSRRGHAGEGKEPQVISFQPTEEQEVVREAMHDFAKSALRPIARECDEAVEDPRRVPRPRRPSWAWSRRSSRRSSGAAARRARRSRTRSWPRSWPGATRRSPSRCWRRRPSPSRWPTRARTSRSASCCRALCSDAPASAAIAFVEPTPDLRRAAAAHQGGAARARASCSRA